MRMPGGLPKYVLIADQLEREINQGLVPVGSLLPSEARLMVHYGVSRYTVRNAVQHLRIKGLVSSRQGQGSRVIAIGVSGAFMERVQSIDELIAVGQDTRRELVDHCIVEADDEISRLFQCDPGRKLAKVTMLRITTEPDSKVIAWQTIWMDALFASAVPALANERRAAAQIIGERFGCPTRAVEQTIQADLLSTRIAAELGAEPGSAALVITRQYATACEEPPHRVARSVFPSNLFKVVSMFTEAPADAAPVEN